MIHRRPVHPRRARALAFGCVALATGGIALWNAPAANLAHRLVRRATPNNPSATRAAITGPWIHGRVALAQGAVLAGGARTVYAEVRLGADSRNIAPTEVRPVALAVALDVSGSMSGEKIEQARRALLEMVNGMREFDQIAIVTYSETPRTLQPLATVRDVRDALRVMIPAIGIEGGTNIPSGLALASNELRNARDGLVRRVVLMSDGQDQSGMQIETVRASVRSQADYGVTMSALGIGSDYDERFMSTVADAGHGNYEFLREGAQLATFLQRELQQATGTVVDRAVAEVQLPAGWTLVRAMGTEAQGTAGAVRLPVGSLFAGDERRMVLELNVPAGETGNVASLGVAVRYHAVADRRDISLDPARVALRTVASEADVTASRDVQVYAETESTALAARQTAAVMAWREGRVQEAQQIAAQNVATLRTLQVAAPSAALAAQVAEYSRDQAAFGSMGAGSAQGREYGLQSGVANRARAMRSGVPSTTN